MAHNEQNSPTDEEMKMMQETEGIVHREMNFLPLTTNANIHEGNALRMDWKEILPPGDDVRIMGNLLSVIDVGTLGSTEVDQIPLSA